MTRRELVSMWKKLDKAREGLERLSADDEMDERTRDSIWESLDKDLEVLLDDDDDD